MSKADELSKLVELKKQSILSEEEFNQEKAKLLETPFVASSISVSNAASNKVVAGVCGILVGAFGIHKFILGYQKEGVIMLCVSVLTCGFGAIVMHPIGLIEGIIYLCKSDEDFVRTYVQNKKEWF